MTPTETFMTIEAATWHREQEHRLRAWLAWQTARLGRVKRFPTFDSLIKAPEAKALSDEEAVERRSEFEELKAKWQQKQRL